MHRPLFAALALLAASAPLHAQSPARRGLRPGDVYRLRDVGDPQRSPDGRWVAYTVTRADSATDKNDTDLWMVSFDGARTVRLTATPGAESTPRWSPDGRYLAFLSSRDFDEEKKDDDAGAQLWLLDRTGGEAQRATEIDGDVEDYAWSPDGKRLVLVVTANDSTEKGPDGKKRPKPIVIDRYHFKQDIVGYLGAKRRHLYLFDLATRKAELLTPGTFDESLPSWSPDGRRIAFVSKRDTSDVDRTDNWDVFVMDARPGAEARRLTTSPGEDNPPGSSPLAWSPDGKYIAYLQGDAPKYYAYNQAELAIVPVAGGAPRVLAPALDRPVSDPQWTRDGRAILCLVTDDRSQYVARVDVASGAARRVTPLGQVVYALASGPDAQAALLVSDDTTPSEVYAMDARGVERRLTRENDAWLAELRLAPTTDFASRSADGTEVHGVLVTPADAAPGARLPLLLRIHGGPNWQEQHDFSFERQLFAADGYAVLAVNYRGSNGRGHAYQQAIYGDWGHLEVVDLLGAVDQAVRSGVADSTRLGIGGWSYGGILTDYTIATTPRFRAAISGAGSALQLAMYGVDQYVTQYETEIGAPWKAQDRWIAISYPFFHADRIHTPTLFMGGDRDFNVPLVGGEQMYQALRSLGVPTELVIYPGQFHGITRPSFRKDRLERYVAWYDRWLKPTATAAAR